jgi:type IV pilus assembly protein PilM
MLRTSYNRFFPTPHFLEMPSFGFDISDESLKFVKLDSTKDGIRISKYGEKKIPAGIVESGKIVDAKKFEELLVEVKKEQGVKAVRVSLLESQIYLFKLSLDKQGVQNIREAIELSLEEHIPIPAGEAVFDYDLIEETEKNLELQVAAIPRNVIEDYLSVFKNTGIFVHSFEIEAQSIARAIVKKGDMETYMIVDFGEKRTGIFIISKGVVMFTSTLDIGGMTLTNMIEKNFQISFEEAEKMKRQYGLQRNTVNKELFSVLLNSVSILRDEVAKHFVYWNTRQDEEGRANPLIKKIILCGGDSNLIGLADYFSISLKTEVIRANVWINIVENVEKDIPNVNYQQALSFASAIGLALGDFEHD